MGIYIGIIEKKGYDPTVFFNFKPIAEIQSTQVIQLTAQEQEALLPESEKRNICFTYSWNVDNERRRMDANFSEKSLVLFEFTLEDLQPNFKANGDRNQTGYKVSAMEMLDEGKIRPVGNFGVYFAVRKNEVVFMFTETKRMLENGLACLTKLRTKFAHLWTMYNGALRIKPEIMVNEPRPSHVFLSVPQYNRIFVQIHKWFQFGIYDFTKENFMLSFIKISSLYEGYLLAKMIAYFQSRGYVLESTRKCAYPIRRNWKYKNTNCVNTLFFKNERHQLTLYYQPVIYDTDESGINGIGLIRNNSIPALTGDGDDNRSGGHYYSPDYLIKMEDDSSVRYLILDAKFSDLACVRRHHVRDLAFKYLFSISPIRPIDAMAGLCIIYGKCKASNQIQSAYDKQLQNQQITPIAELLPLIESVSNDEHYSNLDALMRKAFISY